MVKSFKLEKGSNFCNNICNNEQPPCEETGVEAWQKSVVRDLICMKTIVLFLFHFQIEMISAGRSTGLGPF